MTYSGNHTEWKCYRTGGVGLEVRLIAESLSWLSEWSVPSYGAGTPLAEWFKLTCLDDVP